LKSSGLKLLANGWMSLYQMATRRCQMVIMAGIEADVTIAGAEGLQVFLLDREQCDMEIMRCRLALPLHEIP
jgi:succinylglutamate desuccinylase